MKYIATIFIIIIPLLTYGQHKVGDIKVNSLEELFATQSNMWQDKQDDKYIFNDEFSKIFVSSSLSSYVYQEGNSEKIVILGTDSKFDQDEMLEKLIRQMTNQYGSYLPVDVPVIALDGPDKYQKGYKWIVTGKDINYRIRLTKGGINVTLRITKTPKIPKF